MAEFVQVEKTQLDELIAQNTALKEKNAEFEKDSAELADSIGQLEKKYQLFTVLSKLDGSNWLKIGNGIIQVLRKISADPNKNQVFDRIKNIAIKYAHLAK